MERVTKQNVMEKKKGLGKDDFIERQAQQQAADDGQPIMEKTIFIVKPIYVPVHIAADNEITGKKISKKQKKLQKAIQ